MAEKPFPILIIASPRLGDAIHASGLVGRLASEVPNARFTVVAGESSAPIFRDVPGLEQIIVDEGDGFMPGWRLWWKVRGRLWGLILDLRGTGVSSFLRRRRRGVWHAPKTPTHKVVQFARALHLEDDPPAPSLFVNEDTTAQAAARANGHGQILVIAPGASWTGKAWPPERFAGLAARFLAPDGPMPNGRLIILGDNEARDAGRAVKLAVSRDRIILEPGGLGLLATYALLKHARLVIGNDSASTLLAAAAGAPTLALFGPSEEHINAPWGEHVRALRGPRDFEAFRKLDPNLNQAMCHMLDLSVNTVVAAARALLADTEPDRG